MQVFIPYASPIDVAKCLDPRRLRKQVIECEQIERAVMGESKAWSNHPVTKMYAHNLGWLHDYTLCLAYFVDGNVDMAQWWSDCADGCRPAFITDELCRLHRRRLYAKAPELYPDFEKFGASEENWYVIDGETVKYVNGKRL